MNVKSGLKKNLMESEGFSPTSNTIKVMYISS